MDKIKTEKTKFIDEYSRQRIFYGVNFGSKRMPISVAMKNYENHIKDTVSFFKEHGFNVIRYILNWQYLEPAPGQYSETVLRDIGHFLDLCLENNIYVILDMHQDLYSSFTTKPYKENDFVFGDGAPVWACVTDGRKRGKFSLVWASGYFRDKAVHNAFENFWNNTEVFGRGLQDRFCDLWRMLAKKFGNHPAVLGFDLLNEPFPGKDGGKIFNRLIKSAVTTGIKSPKLDKKSLIKSVFSKNPVKNVLDEFGGEFLNEVTEPCDGLLKKFDEEKYSPFVNKLTSAIREETENGIIFLENCYYANLGIPLHFSPETVNGQQEKKQALAPHAYDFMVDSPLYKYANNSRVGAIFRQRKTEESSYNLPVLVGEWGGGGIDETWLSHCDFLLKLFDRYQWSSAYWCYDEKLRERPVMKTLCRPHPVAVCGYIEEYGFDKEAEAFSLSFVQDGKFDVPTEIFCHKKPSEIASDGRYTLERLSAYTYMLKLFTEEGRHKIEIKF